MDNSRRQDFKQDVRRTSVFAIKDPRGTLAKQVAKGQLMNCLKRSAGHAANRRHEPQDIVGAARRPDASATTVQFETVDIAGDYAMRTRRRHNSM